MRIRLRALGALVLAVLLAVPFSALGNDQMQINVSIPARHTIALSCGANGQVRVGSLITYTGVRYFSVARFGSFGFTVMPAAGYEIATIKCTTSEGFKVNGTQAALARVHGNASISVTFKKPSPTPTPTAVPTPVVTPKPTAYPVPNPVPNPVVPVSPTLEPASEMDQGGEQLYNQYLGAQGGMSDLLILYDKHSEPQDYKFIMETYPEELLFSAIPAEWSPERREQALAELRNSLRSRVRIVSQPDTWITEDGESEILTDINGEPLYSQRSLRLNGAQIAHIEEHQIELLEYDHDTFRLSLSLSELHGQRISKLLVLMNELGTDFLSSSINEDFVDQFPAVKTWQDELTAGEMPRLPYEVYKKALLEIRVTPVLTDQVSPIFPDEPNAAASGPEYLTPMEEQALSAQPVVSKVYRAQVILSLDGAEMDVTSYLNTLQVSMSVQAMYGEERERLIQQDVPEDQADEMTRKSLLERVSLASITDEVYSELNTLLQDRFLSGEINTEMLRAAPRELYNARVLNGKFIMTEAVLIPQVEVDYQEQAPMDILSDYRLSAIMPSAGLYFIIALYADS